jgi:hypothetical protein
LPHASVAVHVRVALKVLPQSALVVVTFVTLTLPHVSLAVGASKVHAVPHSAVLFATQVITGGVVSITEKLLLHRFVHPAAAVTVTNNVKL